MSAKIEEFAFSFIGIWFSYYNNLCVEEIGSNVNPTPLLYEIKDLGSKFN